MIIFFSDSSYLLLQMNHFMVRTFQKSKSQPCLWSLAVYTFGHKDLQTCQMWVNKINDSLSKEVGRPKNLLVYIYYSM